MVWFCCALKSIIKLQKIKYHSRDGARFCLGLWNDFCLERLLHNNQRLSSRPCTHSGHTFEVMDSSVWVIGFLSHTDSLMHDSESSVHTGESAFC